MSFTTPLAFTTRPTLRGHFGMVASTHWLASSCGMAVLERGGNAFDAAVTAGFVLLVVEPHFNGIGGELVGLFATSSDPQPRVVAGAGPAPRRAEIGLMASLGLRAVPGAGLLGAPVPGQFDAWMLLLRDHGTWELNDVLAYAIEYAERGFPVTRALSDTIANVAGLFYERWTTSYEMWTPGGRVPLPGETIANHRLARTLDRLRRESAGGSTREDRIDRARLTWAEGFVVDEVTRFARTASWNSGGVVHPGLLEAQDFSDYRATYEPAVKHEFFGHEVAKAGPWTQGPVLLQMLAMVEGLSDESLDPSTPEGSHAILESVKLAMADREAYFGDGDVPLADLLSPDYLARRRELIGATASHEMRPGTVRGRVPYDPPSLGTLAIDQVAGAGEPTVGKGGQTRGDTCHVDVADRWGAMLSITPSGGWLQSSPYIPSLGFALSSRLQQTWLDETSPAALQPGKRPRLTLSPTLVSRGGTPVSALGTPGGDGQDQWQLLYLLRTLVGGYAPQQAIDAPAFQSHSFPDSFWPRAWIPGGVSVEDRMGSAVIESLSKMGHVVLRCGDWSLGRLSAVTRNPETGELSGAANPRGSQGYAVGR